VLGLTRVAPAHTCRGSKRASVAIAVRLPAGALPDRMALVFDVARGQDAGEIVFDVKPLFGPRFERC
jgi:hypothetical protein